jgi:hypothetical protein
MREVCFCGRVGEIADREPVYAGDGEWGLACPACGHLDRMTLFPEGERRRLLEAAAQRQREAQQNDPSPGVPIPSPVTAPDYLAGLGHPQRPQR